MESLGEISIGFGRCRSYFDAVKKQTPDRFNFIMSFDSDRRQSVKKYVMFVENLILKLQEEVYKDERLSKVLMVKAGYNAKNISASRWGLEQRLFIVRDNFLNVKYSALKRYIKLSKLIDEAKSE